MSLISSKSPLTVLSPFEIFANSPVQTTIVSTRTDEIRPVSQLNTGGYIEFNVNSNFNEYIKLGDIFLYVKFRVKLSKFDKTNISIEDWKNVSLINNVFHSLWNQVDLSINDIQTTISLLTYSQKAYFNTILYSTNEARTSHLEATGFYYDSEKTHYNGFSDARNRLLFNTVRITPSGVSHGAANVLDVATAAATGGVFKTTVEIKPPTPNEYDHSNIIELSGRIYLDFLNQAKNLIGGTKLKFKFVLNRPEYIFMLKDTNLYPQIEFLDAYLEVPKCIVSDEVLIAHNQALNISPAKYVIDRFEVRSQTIDKGVTGKNVENVINGQLPRKIFVALVENEAFNGSFTHNPFLYKHFDIFSITCFVDGQKYEYTPNFDQRLFLKEYLGLCKVTNQADNTNRMMVNKRNFELGYTIFAFNLSQDGSDGFNADGYVNPPKEGIVRFELQFKKQTPSTINILFFCEFDNIISINNDRNPTTDF